MGIDAAFQASHVTDVARVEALPNVYKVYRPGSTSFASDCWAITTLMRWPGFDADYTTAELRAPVLALMRALRPYCTDLEYGGDNGTWFEKVTDELIAAIEGEV